MLALYLLGPFEARLAGQPLPQLHSRKGQWLLALLALQRGRLVERDWLAATLWPESTEEQATANLRRSLWYLRQALGTEAWRLASPTRSTFRLDLAGAFMDVVTFEEALARGDEASLEAAVALYRGPLLPDCPDEWILVEREAREQAYLGALERLAAAASARGEHGAAAGALRRVIAVDALRESAQRALMEALAAGGDCAAALHVYREYRLLLHRELNAAPASETTALFQRLRGQAHAFPGEGEKGRRGVGESGPQREGLVPGSPSPLLPFSPSLPSGTVTFLFTDIEGSARLWEQHPDAMRAALARHDALLRDAIVGSGGHVFKTMGDQFCAAFATAAEAVAAALAAQRALQGEAWGAVGVLRVRMALHTGAADAREGDYLGPPLNRVARLLDAGHGGQVLLSQATADLVPEELPPGASLCDLGAHRLRDLQRREHVFALRHAELPGEFSPLRSLEALPNNLPQQVTSFIGRENEIAAAKRLLGTTHLLTLTGTGGTGKTRLALQAAADLLQEYPDGVWLVELAPLADPALVPQTVASALGVREEPGRTLTQTLVDALKPKRLLLVLDNCEHVLAACAQLTDALLRGCPGVRILATSREGLNAAGEQTYRVPSLALPAGREVPPLERLQEFEAVRLFADRAILGQPSFAVTSANAAAVVQICHRLDGIPLAIELAAARVKALPVEKIAERLGDRFRLLTGGSRTALPRQQTLRALIDWSYDLLTEEERTLLRRLSVFAGGWTLEAAEAVCAGSASVQCEVLSVEENALGPPDSTLNTQHLRLNTQHSTLPLEEADVLDRLTALVEKSLVVYEEGEGEARYSLLETVRQYARDRLLEVQVGAVVRRRDPDSSLPLAAAHEAEAIRWQHAQFFLALAEEAEPRLRSAEQLEWLDRWESEQDNLRAALGWCSSEASGAEAALRLAAALGDFWMTRGSWREGREWLERALSGGTHAPPGLRARALTGLAFTVGRSDDQGLRRSLARESLDLARAAGDRWLMARSLCLIGGTFREHREFEPATALGEQSLALAQEASDPWLIGQALMLLGMIAREQKEYERALRLLGESLTLMRRVGDRSVVIVLLLNLADIAWTQGRFDQAAGYCKEGIACCRELEDAGRTAWCLWGLAAVAAGRGQAARAARLVGAVASALEANGQSMPTRMQAEYEETKAQARAALGEEAFAAAWAAGRQLTLDAAVAYALEEPDAAAGSEDV